MGGGVTAEGRGEAILGLAFMRMGENSREVTAALDRAMDDIKKTRTAKIIDFTKRMISRRSAKAEHAAAAQSETRASATAN